MNGFKLLALMALAAPAIASAQVGPNPSVSGGSQSPTVRGPVDAATAPQDVRIGEGTTGNVINRQIDTPTRPIDDSATTDTGTGATDAGTSTTTRTEATTQPMKKAGRGR